MSATNELRRMLAERGIETGHGSPVVWDCANGHAARATNYDGALTVQAVMTPEQAIAATLGSCNCSNSERTNDIDAKLRELVRHLRECTRHNVCAACEYAGDACDFDYDMRKLGVEVDG